MNSVMRHAKLACKAYSRQQFRRRPYYNVFYHCTSQAPKKTGKQMNKGRKEKGNKKLKKIKENIAVRLSLCLTKHHAKRAQRGVDVQLHTFLFSELDRGERSVSCRDRYVHGKIATDIYCRGDWMVATAGLDCLEKRPCRHSKTPVPLLSSR
jgi:hypothetical protein